MLTLSLLRHAKSSWDDSSLADFERPLNKRGETAAPRMGAFMAQHDLTPGLVLCSSAVRARQTLDLVLSRLPERPQVIYQDSFYLAAPAIMLARLQQVDAERKHVMIVGHDPGMQALALDLAGDGDPKLLHKLSAKFPTAGLAIIRFKRRSWSKIASGTGRLELFVTPRSLL